MSQEAEFALFLHEALGSTLGLVLKVSNLELGKVRLYAARKQDPQFARLQIRTSPMESDEIWIVKGPQPC